MSDYNYEIIKESVMEWYEKISSDMKNENNMEIKGAFLWIYKWMIYLIAYIKWWRL